MIDIWRFISVEPVDKLADITRIPKSGWTKEEYVTPGNGYVIVHMDSIKRTEGSSLRTE